MVKLNVKRRDDVQFLYDTTVTANVAEVLADITAIYNGRLKISRLCDEMEELAKHGTMFPPNILGLTDEQVEELKLVDEWGETCIPSGGWTLNKDPVGRRNGRQPSEKMQEVISKTVEEAKAMVSKKLAMQNVCLTIKTVLQALDILRGATMIVYPMNLPPHDVIRHELENTEDLSGTQASLEVIDPALAQLWCCGRAMQPEHKLSEYVGKNEKSKVIVKLAKRSEGAPAREPVYNEEERKQMMLHAYRRQEELKKIETEETEERRWGGDDKVLMPGLRNTGIVFQEK